MKIGSTISATVVERLSRTQIVQYAGASGDFNPLHTDEPYAVDIGGRSSVFAHGMLTMAMTGRLLTDHFPVDRILRFGGRFKAVVWPGDTLAVIGEVVARTDAAEGSTELEIRLETTRQDGESVFSGYATVRISR